MEINVKYFLQVEKIMGKSSDIFKIDNKTTLLNVLSDNISNELLDKLKDLDLMIICNGKNYNDFNVLIEDNCDFCICPKLYGG